MIIFGPPGIGKGTFGRKIASDYNFDHMVIGDLLRREAKKQSLLASQIRNAVSNGHYVSDEIICDTIRTSIESRSGSVVLDGAPRTKPQAAFLKRLAASMNLQLLGITLDLDRQILIQRICGRRVCEICNRTYNVCNINHGDYVMGPLLPSKEDLTKCPGCCDLKMRDDDNRDIVEHRLALYETSQKEVLTSLADVPFMRFDIKRGIDDYHLLRKELDIFLTRHLE